MSCKKIFKVSNIIIDFGDNELDSGEECPVKDITADTMVEIEVDDSTDIPVEIAEIISGYTGWLIQSFTYEEIKASQSRITGTQIDICQELGWTVCECDDGTVELVNFSPAGENLVFSFRKDNFPNEVMELAEDFDVDDHVRVWVDEAGKNGVPSIRGLVEDADEIKKMLIELSNALNS